MNLYLVQHAEAKPEEEDPQRPLSDKGQHDIREVASFLGGLTNLNLNAIFHSGKMRAQQTAEVLAEYLHPAKGVCETDSLNPMDDVSIWAKRLESIEDDIMLVGHLPHLDKLVALLLCQDENKSLIVFQMAGTVSLNRDESGNYAVAWMLVPRMLE